MIDTVLEQNTYQTNLKVGPVVMGTKEYISNRILAPFKTTLQTFLEDQVLNALIWKDQYSPRISKPRYSSSTIGIAATSAAFTILATQADTASAQETDWVPYLERSCDTIANATLRDLPQAGEIVTFNQANIPTQLTQKGVRILSPSASQPRPEFTFPCDESMTETQLSQGLKELVGNQPLQPLLPDVVEQNNAVLPTQTVPIATIPAIPTTHSINADTGNEVVLSTPILVPTEAATTAETQPKNNNLRNITLMAAGILALTGVGLVLNKLNKQGATFQIQGCRRTRSRYWSMARTL